MKDKIMGKFENEKQLVEAYKKLETEFTKRCQKIAELEKEIERIKQEKSEKDVSVMLSDSDFIDEFVLSNDKIVNAVISAYLKSLRNKNSVNVLGSNGTVALYVNKKPTTLREAKALADAIISHS